MGFLNKLFGLPAYASEHGKMVDHMLELLHWFMLVLFIGWSIFLTYVIIRYRAGANPKANYRGVTSTASNHIEIGVIITEVILLLGFAFPLWAARVDQFPNPDVRINAIGEQFKWSFHYPGADGKFGLTDRYLISPENPVGLDIRDPNSHDDFVADTNMVIPLDKTVEIAVTSKDVIHNLALKSMRHATDADPGKVNRMWFKPIVAGNSEIVCGQLCGAGHGNMKGGLEVKKYDKFLAWEKGNQTFAQTDYGIKKLKELGLAPAAPATVTTPAATEPAAGTPAPAAGTPAPAATTPAPAAPATPAAAAPDPAQMERGKVAFMTCAACHGPDGKGLPTTPPMAPALVGSKLALGHPDVPAAIVINGIAKTDAKYLGIMAPLGAAMSDEQLADVLTYVRNSWGNSAPAVSAAEVKAARAKAAANAAATKREDYEKMAASLAAPAK